MLNKLNPDRYRDFYRATGSARFPLVNAVAEGSQDGEIYTSAEEGDTGNWILHKSGFSLVRDCKSDTFISNIADEVRRSIRQRPFIHIYDCPPRLHDHLNSVPDVNVRLRERIQMRLPSNHGSRAPVKTMPSVMLNASLLNSLDRLAVNVTTFWRSKGDFLSHGLGTCVLNSTGEPLSVCYSAAISSDIAEVDIKTDVANQRIGLAAAAFAGFLGLCSERQVVANWDCFVENTASIKTAEKFGLVETYRYPFISIYQNATT